jgi:hypothetical protein
MHFLTQEYFLTKFKSEQNGYSYFQEVHMPMYPTYSTSYCHLTNLWIQGM